MSASGNGPEPGPGGQTGDFRLQEPPSFGAGDLHVWEADIEASEAQQAAVRRWLSPAELQRAEALVHERDRARFVLVRGILRALLAAYLRTDPLTVPLVYGEFGKPMVADSFGRRLHFNLSHAGAKALFVMSGDSHVGVDIETLAQTVDLDVASLFSPSEQQALEALEGTARRDGFFRCWTRKEAYGKAIGRGLGIALDQVSMLPLDAVEPSAPIIVTDADGVVWQVHDLPAEPGYAAALAVEAGPGHRIVSRRWSWPPTT